MTVVISVFTLCCLASPLYDLVNNLKLITPEMQENGEISKNIQSEYDDRVVEVTAGYINEYVNALLESENVCNAQIETIMTKDKEGGIYISEMNIYLNGSENVNKKNIEDMIYTATGVVPYITER